MKNKILIFISLLLYLSILSCNNNDVNNETSTPTFALNEFELSAIPFDEARNAKFVNQNDEIFNALASAKRTSTRYLILNNDILVQTIENDLTFDDSGVRYTTTIEKGLGNTSHIYVKRFEDVSLNYGLESLATDNLEEILIDTESNGFTFKNVILLTTSDPKGFILYSPKNGIEFIEKNDGNYLRRIE